MISKEVRTSPGMTNRRKFMQNLFLGAGGLTLGYFGYRSVRPVEKAMKLILIEDLKGLKISLVDVDAYVKSATLENALNLKFAHERLICLFNAMPFKDIPLPLKDRYLRLRADIVGNFLLSTNFFINKMDETKDVVYSGTVYKNYGSACINPFSNLYYA